MIEAGEGAIIATGNTSALRGKANFAGFAPTKAAQRILAESIARDLGPKGVHVAYVVIDAVIDLEWTRKRFADAPDDFFIKPAAIADEVWHVVHQERSRVVVQRRDPAVRARRGEHVMSQLRIFSYLPNPRIWKATIAARLCGVEVEVRGAPPTELQSWLWDFDARPLSRGRRIRARGREIGRTGFKGVKLRKTRAFLEAHPFGTVPAAFSPDGTIGIFESNSIMRAVARLGERTLPALRAAIPTRRRAWTASSTRASSSLAMRRRTCCRCSTEPSLPRFNREPGMLSPPISAGSVGRCFRSATSWSATGSLSPTSASSPSSRSSRTSEHGETCSNDEASRRSSTG